MKKPSVLTLVVLIIAVRGMAYGEDPPRPNILFLYVDDMGWGSIGPNGQADRKEAGLPSVLTPNLDQLASAGINFTRGYGCHVCSPARSSLQTGFHQGHTYADRNDPNNARKAIRTDDRSIGTMLSQVGYVTGYWGKWGYGGSKDLAKPSIDNVQTLPTSHGYQHVLAELHHVRAHTFFQPTLWRAPAAEGSVGGVELTPNRLSDFQNDSQWPEMPARQNHPDYPEVAYCDDSYAFAALRFVRDQGQHYNDTGQPFFGLLAVQIPHAPFGEISVLPEWEEMYQDDPHSTSLSNQTRQWRAMVTRMDAHFGNLLDALKDPNNDGDESDSIADNTLVIFQSDNGGPAGKNHLELDANGGLSGVKGRIQEGGIRVPLVMRWPERIGSDTPVRAGTDCDRVVDVTDLFPTFCELAGAEIPVGIDGVSIAPFLMGSNDQRKREFIIHEAGNGQSIIRGDYKLVRTNRGDVALFHLVNDPAEKRDLAETRPKLVKELESLLLAERVTEPKGFANTYHRWEGKNGGDTSDPNHWSDYVYANAGITYMTDDGPPQSSWIAHFTNASAEPNVAVVQDHLDVLGVEILGNSESDAPQQLVLGSGHRLTGRNEIRLGAMGELLIQGGSVSTLRWIDIHPGGKLSGQGTIRGSVYNAGLVETQADGEETLHLQGDYYQSAEGSLSVSRGTDHAALQVEGVAHLGGKLHLDPIVAAEVKPGVSIPILSAKSVQGKFIASDDGFIETQGRRFQVEYTDSSVSLMVP